MKKILSVIAAVLICVLIFYGCEKSDTNGAQSGAQTSTGGEPSVSESAAESEHSEPSQEESAEQQQKEVLFKELNEEYLPLYGILINDEEWSSAGEIDVEMFYAWYTDYTAKTMQYEDRKERYSGNEPGWHYPAAEFEEFVQRYFDVSTETLRESDAYVKSEDCYTVPAGGWRKDWSFSVASPDDISVSGSTATAKLTCISNLDFADVHYRYLTLDIAANPHKFTGCRMIGTIISVEKQLEMTRKYLMPLQPFIGLRFDSADELGEKEFFFLGAWEGFRRCTDTVDVCKFYGLEAPENGWQSFPAKQLEHAVMEHFDVTAKQIRGDGRFYDSEQNCYALGTAPEPGNDYLPMVLDYEFIAGEENFIAIRYAIVEYGGEKSAEEFFAAHKNDDIPKELVYTLKIRENKDGWKYISNK